MLSSPNLETSRVPLDRRLLTRAALSLALSLAVLDLTAAGLGALPVSLPETLVVAGLGDVVGSIALRFARRALDLLLAVGDASRPNAAGISPGTIFGNLPALSTTYHDFSAGIVASVGTKDAVDPCGRYG